MKKHQTLRTECQNKAPQNDEYIKAHQRHTSPAVMNSGSTVMQPQYFFKTWSYQTPPM